MLLIVIIILRYAKYMLSLIQQEALPYSRMRRKKDDMSLHDPRLVDNLNNLSQDKKNEAAYTNYLLYFLTATICIALQ